MSDDGRSDGFIDNPLVESPPRTTAPFAVAAPAPVKAEIPDYLRALLEPAPPPPPAPTSRPKRWLCFGIAGQSFAVELLKVQEVQRVPSIVPVRGAAADVLGVINLRGEILHVLDLGIHLGFAPCDAGGSDARVIVLEENGKTVGLLVSKVADLVTLGDSDIELAEPSLRPFPCAALLGVTRHATTLMALLDASELLK